MHVLVLTLSPEAHLGPVQHLLWSFDRKQLKAFNCCIFPQKSSIVDFRLGYYCYRF